MNESLVERRTEFELHVWDHAQDQFQLSFDARKNLSDEHSLAIQELTSIISAHGDVKTTHDCLTRLVQNDKDLILTVLQIVGLTRSKIITDLKGKGLRTPNKPENLISKPDIWIFAGARISERLHDVLGPLTKVDESGWVHALEAINQSTWPGWIRQERAKRQGHEAEGRIAALLSLLNLNFEPKEKATNPLCQDVQINKVSFDIISLNQNDFKVGFKSTVQTSNIGQFGESKGGLEVREAHEMVQKKFQAPYPLIVAMVDGVGFHSNTAGLNEILSKADEFCQFATIWKAAVIVAASQNVSIDLQLSDRQNHEKFLDRYEKHIKLCEPDNRSDWHEAGEALVRRS